MTEQKDKFLEYLEGRIEKVCSLIDECEKIGYVEGWEAARHEGVMYELTKKKYIETRPEPIDLDKIQKVIEEAVKMCKDQIRAITRIKINK